VPPCASWNRPWPIANRARKRAAHVTEELAFEHLVRNGAAVDGDERPFRAPAALVNLSRKQLLAAPRLAENEHGRVGRCHELDLREQSPQRGAVADDPAEGERGVRLFPQIRVLFFQPFLQSVAFCQRRLHPPVFDGRARASQPDRGLIDDGVHQDSIAVGGKIRSNRSRDHGAPLSAAHIDW